MDNISKDQQISNLHNSVLILEQSLSGKDKEIERLKSELNKALNQKDKYYAWYQTKHRNWKMEKQDGISFRKIITRLENKNIIKNKFARWLYKKSLLIESLFSKKQ